MMKKVLAVMICVVMIIGGCQSKSDDSNVQVQTSKEEKGISLSEKGKFPIVDEKITLTVFAPQMSTIEDLSTNLFTKELEELTNIHIEWQTAPQQGLQEKKSLVFNSGNYPDIFLSASLTNEEQMQYGSQGILMPLNDLIDTHSVELKQLFKDIDWLKPIITAPDGNIYALPQINECYHCTLSQKIWINKKWLDNLGLDMPTTTDEFKDVLVAFKTKDPNGNGLADEVPLTGAIKSWHTEVQHFLLSSFIYTDGEDYNVAITDGKVELIADKEEYREGLKYLNDLYSQGLIDPAAFTQTSEQLKQLGESPDAEMIGACTAGWFGAFTQLGGERSKDYVVMPPLKGPKGARYAGNYPYGYTNGQFAISSTNKYPEASIKWVDYLYSELGSRRANNGREGKEWVKAEEGEMGIDGEPAIWKRTIKYDNVQNICWAGLEAPSAITAKYRGSEVAGDPFSVEGFETRLFQETKKMEGYQPDEVLPPLYFTAEEITEIAQFKKPISDYIDEYTALFILGNKDLDNDWDAYVKGLKNLGSERYIEILQKAYNASSFAK